MALLALLMLSFATVQATIMQAALAQAEASAAAGADDAMPPMPGMMPGMMAGGRTMAAAPARPHQPDVAPVHKTACPYCAAAANLPVAARMPASVRRARVVFVRFRTVAACGPRGLPLFDHRARGPPTDPEPA